MARRRRGFGESRWAALTGGADFTTEAQSQREKQEFEMITREKAANIFDRLRKFSSADEIEVLFSGGRFALTRFANNAIHQNVAEENQVVSVRTVFAGRTARAFTNKFDDDSLRRVVESSESLAKVQHPDPDLLSVPTSQEADGLTEFAPGDAHTASFPSRYYAETAASTPDLRADGVAKVVDVAQKHQFTTAGIFSSSESSEGIFNSRGLSNWYTQTLAEVSITMLGGDSSGWQKANSPDIANLDPQLLAEVAAQKTRDSERPVMLPAGKYTVILEPAAVLDAIGSMFWDFSGMAILDQRSFLTGRIGSKLFGDNITIWDDVSHPLQAGSPFDGEGVRRHRVPLVENGVVRRVVYARSIAKRMKGSEHRDKAGQIEATGHGFALPNEMGEMPVNIVFASPENPQSVTQMIASTEHGVLVTRLWYIREVDPFEKIVTGMTRDGTFLVENGRVRQGIRNFRFNQSLIHMLSNVEAMSMPVRSCGEESFDMVVPAMKIRDFNFTEVTKF
jgi:PmbA protein